MLTLVIPGNEIFNELTGEFTYENGRTIQMEHSLISISKWESKWNKPFLSKDRKSTEEILDYMACMSLSPVDSSIFANLSSENIDKVQKYIEAPMTATTFSKNHNSGKGSSEIITSELIYYWMIALSIPFECQKWHINRLLTLVQVCNIKNTPPKKMSKNEIMNKNRALNAARRAASGSRG